MPITFIEGDALGHTCAACGGERKLRLRDVHVRSREDQGPTGAVLELPACPRCKSIEVLVRATRADGIASSDVAGHPHQLIVEILTARLGDFALTPEAETEIARVFPGGVRMDAAAAAK